MKNDTLCCDYCGEKHNYIPIIEKPSRFGFRRFMRRRVNDGRKIHY
jgi:hypothetical protein